jgi:hypothetical protein
MYCSVAAFAEEAALEEALVMAKAWAAGWAVVAAAQVWLAVGDGDPDAQPVQAAPGPAISVA